MDCPHCHSSSTTEREGRTVHGFRRFRCRGCGRRYNERTGTALNRVQVPTDIMFLIVFWRLRYKLRSCLCAPGEAGAIQPVEREGGSARPVASVAGSSATMVLKRTQRDDEDCIELRKLLTVEAEALQTAAGNMCGTVLQGTVAPPESERLT